MNVLNLVISIALFILSLLIFFSVRSSDKKSRSLANVNAQIKSFRSEVSATSQRLLTTAQDCTDSVQSHVEKARNTVDIVNTCLDRLAQHQKDLTDLEGVCVDYRRALDKLKVQTEQAEARIAVVQQEVRKAENVSEFVKQFHEESEFLVNQMQDLKAEYVRLVTSTQEQLKQQAALQKSDNTEMLREFASAVERQKSQLVEFINVEKQAFARECDEQARIAESITEKIREFRSDAEESIKIANENIQSIKEGVKAFSDEERETLERLRDEIDASIDALKRDAEDEKKALDDKTKESIETLSTSFDGYVTSFSQKRVSFEELLESKFNDLDKRILSRESDLKESIAAMSQDVDDRISSLSKEKDAYTEKAKIGYRAALISELEGINESFEKIKASCADQIESLAKRAEETRETVSDLAQGESERLQETISKLKELEEKISLSEANLTSIQEQVTQAKEELYKSQKEQGKLVSQINETQKELERAQKELSMAKDERFEHEARTVKLQLEMGMNKEKEAEKESKSRAESIIEQFPEDIFIGDAEEVSFDDDDDE